MTQTLTQALKEHSASNHDSVDELVMSMQPFAHLQNYRKFLQAQYAFHKTVNPIYHNNKLADGISDLTDLARFERVKKDMADLQVAPFDGELPSPIIKDDEAIGWLYCAEGSNVGAAILYKEAGKIKLDDGHGASHLASHPEGRMTHWRNIKTQIDELNIDDVGRKQAIKGANDAFDYFKQIILTIYGKTSHQA